MAVKTKGITLGIGATVVAHVKSIGSFGFSVDTVEITELGDAVKKFLATIAELKEVPFGVFFDPRVTSHAALIALRDSQAESGEPEEFVITFPFDEPITYTFDAWLTDFDLGSVEVGGVLDSSFTLKPAGDYVDSSAAEEEEEG